MHINYENEKNNDEDTCKLQIVVDIKMLCIMDEC